MKNILLLQQKGGTGKSTLCSEIVMSLKRTKTPSAFYDLDQQGGHFIKPYKDKGAAIGVIDTPGQLSDKVGEWVSESSVIVIPTLCSTFDIDALMRTLEIVNENRQPDSKTVIVLNRFTRWKSSRDFQEWIQKKDTGADEIVTLPQSELFMQAYAEGKSMVDFRPRSEPAKATLSVINTIRKCAGLNEETI